MGLSVELRLASAILVGTALVQLVRELGNLFEPRCMRVWDIRRAEWVRAPSFAIDVSLLGISIAMSRYLR